MHIHQLSPITFCYPRAKIVNRAMLILPQFTTIYGDSAWPSALLLWIYIRRRIIWTSGEKLSFENAPKVGDVAGTMLLSILSGHTRIAMSARYTGTRFPLNCLASNIWFPMIRFAVLLPKLMSKASIKWLQDELLYCCEPLLSSWSRSRRQAALRLSRGRGKRL
jgi:hypothetical protein